MACVLVVTKHVKGFKAVLDGLANEREACDSGHADDRILESQEVFHLD